MEHTNNPRNSNQVFQSKLSTFPLINIVQASYMNRVSHTSFPFESSFLYLYEYVRVPILNIIRVRCPRGDKHIDFLPNNVACVQTPFSDRFSSCRGSPLLKENLSEKKSVESARRLQQRRLDDFV